MTLWEAIVLGAVQGATEFLPVSSSGHLVIGQTVLGVDSGGVVFEVAVHVATLVSVLVVYRGRVRELIDGVLARDPGALRYVGLLLVASIPAGIVGVVGADLLMGLFERPAVSGGALLVTGVVLWSSRAALRRAGDVAPGWRTALLIGIAQALAIVPGISRSGATVVTALWLGIDAREAAAFSFLLAVPAIAGAAVLQVPEWGAGVGPGWMLLAGGGLVAAATGVVAIRSFLSMLEHRSFHLFAPYCWVVGALFLLYLGLQ